MFEGYIAAKFADRYFEEDVFISTDEEMIVDYFDFIESTQLFNSSLL